MFFDQRSAGERVEREIDTDPDMPKTWPGPARLAFILSSSILLWGLILWLVAA